MSDWTDGPVTVHVGGALDVLRRMPDASVHAVVTSPPYWGLRDYGAPGQLGLEATPEEYVAALVEVFAEVWRVLRPDGTCWLNLGDSYAHGGNGSRDAERWPKQSRNNDGDRLQHAKKAGGAKPKDLLLMPARVALALQADGWWVRSDIAWCKTAPMPESVRDRPTSAWEHVFLLAESETYYYDAEAVREPDRGTDHRRGVVEPIASMVPLLTAHAGIRTAQGRNGAGANMRNYWVLGPEPYSDAHFAVMPSEVARRCIAAGTSERGCCPECAAPWRRCVERQRLLDGETPVVGSFSRPDEPFRIPANGVGHWRYTTDRRTTHWEPTCGCAAGEPVPCIVLDPFAGSGTTLAVARRMGRRAVGIELQANYLPLIQRRVAAAALPLLEALECR